MRILLPLLFCLVFYTAKAQNSEKAPKSISYEWGLELFDIETIGLPTAQFGLGYHFKELPNDVSLSLNVDPALYATYDNFFGLGYFVDAPVSVNLNLGHRITTQKMVDKLLGLTAGVGYEYSLLRLVGETLQLHGPFVQAGLRMKIYRNSYFVKARLHQNVMPVSYPNPPMIHLVLGQSF